jgi:hypothetical protein
VRAGNVDAVLKDGRMDPFLIAAAKERASL